MGAALLRKGVLSVPWGGCEQLPGQGARVGWRPGTGCMEATLSLLSPMDKLLCQAWPGVHGDPPKPAT